MVELVKEWLQNLGIGDHTVVQDDDEADDDAVHLHHDESAKNRDVPSSVALPIIRPALGRQHSISENAKVAMQGYLNHFLGNMDIANSREVCNFLEVSKLSFAAEYRPKLKEDYIMVWAVLKPGFLAFLEDPFDTKLLDIIVFDRLQDGQHGQLYTDVIEKLLSRIDENWMKLLVILYVDFLSGMSD
ncbi:hypothetical protein Syun_029486 [Stephania yunnanensis]|uniref:Uncharacterized protein n=1 Tax=Stephania yunnanensis TaxID=152371 RepID=A0AAP0EA30_9MAGN